MYGSEKDETLVLIWNGIPIWNIRWLVYRIHNADYLGINI